MLDRDWAGINNVHILVTKLTASCYLVQTLTMHDELGLEVKLELQAVHTCLLILGKACQGYLLALIDSL